MKEIKKETKLKQCASSIEPSTWIIIISTNFKYFGKKCVNNYDAWITHHNLVTKLTRIGLTLSTTRATTLAMV
jgi:hypothetical protein